MNRPYDMNVTQDDINAANAWWSTLSLNEMKAMRDKHTGHFEWNGQQVPIHSVHELRPRTIHQIWEEEGKPAPERTTPAEFQHGGKTYRLAAHHRTPQSVQLPDQTIIRLTWDGDEKITGTEAIGNAPTLLPQAVEYGETERRTASILPFASRSACACRPDVQHQLPCPYDAE